MVLGMLARVTGLVSGESRKGSGVKEGKSGCRLAWAITKAAGLHFRTQVGNSTRVGDRGVPTNEIELGN